MNATVHLRFIQHFMTFFISRSCSLYALKPDVFWSVLKMTPFWKLLCIFGSLLCLITLLRRSIFISIWSKQTTTTTTEYLKEEKINWRFATAKGAQTYAKLFPNLYKKYSYALCLNQNRTLQISESSVKSSINFLPLTNRRPCNEVISEWLTKNAHNRKPKIPPRTIPEGLSIQYLTEGYAFVHDWYRNNTHNDPQVTPLKWTPQIVQFYATALQIRNWTRFPYKNETENMVTALKRFPLRGHGLIIGSLQPWLEAICLQFGAETITTAEYHPIANVHPQLKTIHPMELAKTYQHYLEKFDFAASFSSIEHSGLGRYGDNLDPNGDLREVEKIRCFLKTNATLYLSVPMGIDSLYWNVHRIYGLVRYPMIMADFEILGIFRGNQTVDLERFDWDYDDLRHYTVVLRKKNDNECLPGYDMQ